MTKTFFRVSHQATQQGLWYSFGGDFTGLIHDRFSFCHNHELRMEFDPEIVGYLSAVETVEELFAWFSREDIAQLEQHGFYIHEYRASDFKWYERFSHYVINQSTSTIVRRITLNEPSPSLSHPPHHPVLSEPIATADAPNRSAIAAGESCT